MKLFRSMKFSLLIFFTAIAALAVSCNNKCESHLTGKDCHVLSFSLVLGEQPYAAIITADSLIAVVDYDSDLSGAKAKVLLSEGATISPDLSTVTDWSVKQEFTVTGADKSTSRKYVYDVKRDFIDKYYNDNIVFTSQDELDAFAQKKYTRVRSITIDGTTESPITDLSGLSSIVEVDNSLTLRGFQGTDVLFDNMQTVSSIDINSPSVKQVSFNSLTQIDNLMIGFLNEEAASANNATIDKMSFDKLEVVFNNIGLNINTSDEFTFDCFPVLTHTHGDFLISIRRQKDMELFRALKSVNHISIQGLEVESLVGLENLKEVRGQLTLKYLQKLTTMLPFAPNTVGSIFMNSISGLKNLDGFANLTRASVVSISGVPKLENIDGLSKMETIDNGLYIRWANCLTNLNALSALRHVGKTITLTSNPALADFSALKNCLLDFTGSWDVKGNKVNPSIDDIIRAN